MVFTISNTVFSRIKHISYPTDCTIPLTELRYLKVPYISFDGNTYTGELIANRLIADVLDSIFLTLFHHSYPIEKIRLIDEYNGDDDASMSHNNSSCFNHRRIDGTDRLSKHALGLAIDINPLYNPYVRKDFGCRNVLPLNSTPFVDRALPCPYYIHKNDICYELFKDYHFDWGGDWEEIKDYQHFEYTLLDKERQK